MGTDKDLLEPELLRRHQSHPWAVIIRITPLSSPAKADDPVITGDCLWQDLASISCCGGYWMPAFAGMTAEFVGCSRKFRLLFQIMLGHRRPEFFHHRAIELNRWFLIGRQHGFVFDAAELLLEGALGFLDHL